MNLRRRLFLTFGILTFVMSTYGFLMTDGTRPPDQVIGSAVIFGFLGMLVLWPIWEFDIQLQKRERGSSENPNSIEKKKKRDRLDSVIRDLSDEDLIRLRRRLLDGTVDDSHLENTLLGEDGELLHERR